MSNDGAPSAPDLVEILAASHRRLTEAVDGLDADGLRAQSYDDDWSIAQVLSHIGSGTEIFGLYLDAVERGEQIPGFEAFGPVWDRWNGLEPEQQAAEATAAVAAFVDRLRGVPAADRATWSIELFGATRSFDDFVRLRVSEHAVHAWDVIVVLDPAATVLPSAIAHIAPNLAEVIGWAAKPERSVTVLVTVSDPDAALLLSLDPDGSSISTADDSASVADASLSLSSEAFVRLVYGRLDPDHTPDVLVEGVDLDELRRTFPGL